MRYWKRAVHNRTCAIFLLLWTAYGVTNNVHNGRAYGLQQIGVDAVVAHHTFALGLSRLPALQPHGDVFSYQGLTLAAKQPGQFVWGAAPYLVLRALGISYEKNYDLAAALVTWLSTGLFAAAALSLLDRMMWSLWGFSAGASLLATLGVGLASFWFAYAGVAHHDVLAASLLTAGLYAIERNRIQCQGRDRNLALVAGALLGLTVFTSMLPALIVLLFGVYALIVLPWSSSRWCGAGFAAGLLPLFAYNLYYFSNPLLPANVAGKYDDTFFTPMASLAGDHLSTYFGVGALSIWKYAPALGVAAVGLWLLPRGLRYLLVSAVAVHLMYIINIRTLGGCEYGPRYLLPVLPFLAPGLAAVADLRMAAVLVVAPLEAWGFLVSLVGALGTTMYCLTEEFPLGPEMAALRQVALAHYPLLGVAVLLPLAVFLLWNSRTSPTTILPALITPAAAAAAGHQRRRRKSASRH